MNFLAQIGIGFATQFIGYLFTPKGEETASREPREEDQKIPVAEPGRVIAISFGTVISKDPVVLHASERSMNIRYVKASKK
ncbi:hypothetical protein TW83_10005 [Paracoccus sp. S4493]|uniref:hypothetical protein n=1 Tax=Paracoccus sp. S4493 TaxID=579490 RepID=UPI0005FA1FE0|nr:hypothetical protein [Paracoccus sp. S4493]KJZ31246.1 hypothetical protein TW83_10005 [Paracoccus sp. S4493]